MNNKSKIITSKGKLYLTVVAFASLLVMAFNVNTNSMNVHAIDFGLISKDTNIGSIDTSSLFNCVGAAITCDNDNTVNNNIAINNGTNGNGGGGETPLPPIPSGLCEQCLGQLAENQRQILAVQLGLQFDASLADICAAINALGTVEALVIVLDTAELTITQIVSFLTCLGIEISATEVAAILG